MIETAGKALYAAVAAAQFLCVATAGCLAASAGGDPAAGPRERRGPSRSSERRYEPTHAPGAPKRDGDAVALRRWSRVLYADGRTPGEAEAMAVSGDGGFTLAADGAKGVRLNCATRENWSGAKALAFRVVAGAGQPRGIELTVFLKDGDHCWYEATPVRGPVPGEAGEFVVPLGGAGVWRNVGHGKPLGAYSLQDVQEFGLGFFCEAPMAGPLRVEALRLVPRAEKAEALRIVEYREPGRAVGRYERYEIRFRLNRAFDNPFDPEQVDVAAAVAAPSGETWTVRGFFTQNYRREVREELEALTPVGAPYWAVRIVPREVGEHTVRLSIRTPGETLTLKPRTLVVGPSDRKGYVRVSKRDPVHFEFETGEPFYPVGHSVHAPVDEHYHRMQKLPLPAVDRKTLFYDEVFGKMAAVGETFTEIWMCPWWMEIEWRGDWHPFKGLGRYNLENAWRLDYLFSLCERYGIRLQVALMNHGELTTTVDADWQNSPYNRANGGFLRRPREWFKSERAQKLWRQKLQYITARWGGETHLFGWVLISESDLVGPYSGWARREPTYREWAIPAARYLRSIDPGRHPITNHYYGDFLHLDKKLFAAPEIDYMACDCYRCGPRGEGRDLVDLLLGTMALSREMGKPIVISEYGGDWCGAMDNKLKAEQHGGIWAAYMTGMTSTPLFWWFGFVEHHSLYGTYTAFSRFIEGEDRRGKPAKTVRPAVTLRKPIGTPVKAIVRVGEGWLDAWILEDRGLPIIDYFESKRAFLSSTKIHEKPWTFNTISGASIKITDFQPGRYTAEFWDTVKGEVISTIDITVGDDGLLTITTPTFTRDVALKVRAK